MNTYKAFDSQVDYREVNLMVTWSFRRLCLRYLKDNLVYRLHLLNRMGLQSLSLFVCGYVGWNHSSVVLQLLLLLSTQTLHPWEPSFDQ